MSEEQHPEGTDLNWGRPLGLGYRVADSLNLAILVQHQTETAEIVNSSTRHTVEGEKAEKVGRDFTGSDLLICEHECMDKEADFFFLSISRIIVEFVGHIVDLCEVNLVKSVLTLTGPVSSMGVSRIYHLF